VTDPTYGALCNGVADDTVAIQAAITAAQTAGGGTVVIPAGTCNISSMLTVNASNVTISGQGWDMDANGGSAPAVSNLALIGAGGLEAMIKLYPPGGSPTYISSSSVVNLGLFGNSKASYEIESLSNLAPHFEHLYFNNCGTACLVMGVMGSSTSTTKRFIVGDIQIGGGTGDGIWYNGTEEGITYSVICEQVAGYCQHFGGGAAGTYQAKYSQSFQIESRGLTTSTGGILFDCGSQDNTIDTVQSTRYAATASSVCSGSLTASYGDSAIHVAFATLASTLNPPITWNIGAGTVVHFKASDGGTDAYLLPTSGGGTLAPIPTVLNNSGGAWGATHRVPVSPTVSIGSGVAAASATVTFTNAAAFTNATSYITVCTPTANGSTLPAGWTAAIILNVNQLSGTQVQVSIGNLSGANSSGTGSYNVNCSAEGL
jgi:hypothetical protein